MGNMWHRHGKLLDVLTNDVTHTERESIYNSIDTRYYVAQDLNSHHFIRIRFGDRIRISYSTRTKVSLFYFQKLYYYFMDKIGFEGDKMTLLPIQIMFTFIWEH